VFYLFLVSVAYQVGPGGRRRLAAAAVVVGVEELLPCRHASLWQIPVQDTLVQDRPKILVGPVVLVPWEQAVDPQ